MIHNHEFEVGGKTFSIESGRVAKQAGGAVLLGMGETVVFASATMSENPREGIDFLPLVCDYEERKYAVGKIPGGFMKRGGRPSEKAILVSRLIDRPVRPLFPKGLRHDLQVIAMTLAVDQNCPPDVMAINAAGAALAVSDVPFNGPIGAARVGLIDGEFILFPSIEQIKVSDLDLVVAGHKGAISMVEAGANEVSEETMAKALKLAHDAIKVICTEFEKFAKKAGKAKREVKLHEIDKDLIKEIEKGSGKKISSAILNPDKAVRESALSDLLKEVVAEYKVKYAGNDAVIAQLPEAVDKVIKDTVRKNILSDDKRPDGRGLRDLRNLEACAGLLPKVHGSGLFTRGQTQVLTVLTLGMPSDSQTMDGLEDVGDKRYMHFYNFPPYSVGEVRPMRGPGRREIGHGALAERALIPVLPFDDPEFPYTLLLISEVLESNGSTSMASVCGSTLALMDAGVPIKAPVAGIAMGLMSDGKVFKVLTDIQGMEDFCGDMDFKVAGTRKGITALQLDTKLDGIPDSVLASALDQANEARMSILDVMEGELSEPRAEMNDNAPRVTTVQINPDKIGALIGPGGATIRKLTSETGAQIDIQQDGRVLIAATEGTAAKAAIDAVKAITATAEVGALFENVKVTRLMGRGAMVEYLPGKEGLIPTELITTKPIRRPDDALNMGDSVNVRVIEVDSMGRVNLTALGLAQSLEMLAGNEDADPNTKPTPSDRGSDRRGGGRDRGDRGGRDRGGDRGDRGGRDRGDRGGDRGDRGGERGGRDRDRGPSDRAVTESFSNEPAPSTPTEFPKKASEDVNARFRPRR